MIQIARWRDIAFAGSQTWINLLSGNQVHVRGQITARVAILGEQAMKKWQKVLVLQQGNKKAPKITRKLDLVAGTRTGESAVRGWSTHRQPKLILRNLQNVGHYKTLCWGFAHFLKIVEYCHYCGNKVCLPSVHLVLVCCAQFERDSRSI